MAAINNKDLNFWHRSFLTTIIVDHYPLIEFACNKLMFIMCIKAILVALCYVALAYVALASPPRYQHLRCFHNTCTCTLCRTKPLGRMYNTQQTLWLQNVHSFNKVLPEVRDHKRVPRLSRIARDPVQISYKSFACMYVHVHCL